MMHFWRSLSPVRRIILVFVCSIVAIMAIRYVLVSPTSRHWRSSRSVLRREHLASSITADDDARLLDDDNLVDAEEEEEYDSVARVTDLEEHEEEGEAGKDKAASSVRLSPQHVSSSSLALGRPARMRASGVVDREGKRRRRGADAAPSTSSSPSSSLPAVAECTCPPPPPPPTPPVCDPCPPTIPCPVCETPSCPQPEASEAVAKKAETEEGEEEEHVDGSDATALDDPFASLSDRPKSLYEMGDAIAAIGLCVCNARLSYPFFISFPRVSPTNVCLACISFVLSSMWLDVFTSPKCTPCLCL